MAPPPESSNAKDKKSKQWESNPRWLGYCYIMLTSLVCFSSSSNIPDYLKTGEWATEVAIAVFTFVLPVLLLVLDRSRVKDFNLAKALDGKLEGYTLLLFLIIWIINVALLTKPGGLAYFASNIYFSCWLALWSCLYTFDKWSASKDIISFQELTQLSATLKTWYVLWFCSMVSFGSSIHLYQVLKDEDTKLSNDAAYMIAMGLTSAIISFLFILVHYKFFDNVKQGGWLELATAAFLILVWTVSVSLITQHQGLAPTVAGSGCKPDIDQGDFENCTVLVSRFNKTANETYYESLTCQSLYANEVPGSNLYVFVWAGLFCSINLTLRWKAAQAVKFAQAAQSRVSAGAAQGDSAADSDDDSEVEDDEDAI